MSENKERAEQPTAYGLTSIDIITNMVLKDIELRDWEGLTIDLQVLADTNGDAELHNLAKNHLEETENQLVLLRVQNNGLTIAETSSKNSSLTSRFLQKRNLELYWLVRDLMGKKNMLATTMGATPRSQKTAHIGAE